MASIHRNTSKSRYYSAVYYATDGRQIWRSTKQTNRKKAMAVAVEYELAEKKAGQGTLTENHARKVLAEILERTGTGETLRSPSASTYFTEWLAAKEQAKAGGTYDRYEKAVREFLKSLGARSRNPVAAITASHVENFVNQRLASGLAPATVSLDAKVIRTALNKARRMGLISTNPAEAVDLPENRSVERGTFTAAEVRMLIEAAQDRPEWQTLIRVAYYTGQRLSDCVAMRWADINLTAGTWELTQGKTETKLLVPLHPDLLSALEKLAGVDTAAEFVMPGMAGKGPGGRHGLSESFKSIMRAAGIDNQPVERKEGGKIIGVRTVSKRSFHALRHSFTSALMNAGVSSELRMKLTGHKSDAVHGKYSHAELATLREAVGKLPAI